MPWLAPVIEPMLLIDAANVVGSRPTGWWRDRAGAARMFVDQVRGAAASGRLIAPVVVVLEGMASAGVEPGTSDGVEVVHATGSGDDTMMEVISDAAEEVTVTLVTADRGLRQRAEALGVEVVGPSWLLERLE
jgi:predicted ribonuclease YlaK